VLRPELRPYLRNATIVLVLVAANLVVGAGFFAGGRIQEKVLLSFFGDRESLHRALLMWWLFSLLLIAGLLIQQRWPLVALVIAGVGVGGHRLYAQFGLQPLDLALPIVLYTVASRARARWVSAAALAVVVTVDWLISVLLPVTPTVKAALPKDVLTPGSGLPLPGALGGAADSLQMLLIVLLAVAVGDGVRSRREHLHTLQERAADLERDQQQRAALATAHERARISRELHDIVAHGLSVIVVQAQGAEAALRRHPERAEVALQQVINTGRSSLAEMRRLLGVVRQDPLADPRQSPEPGIGALSELIDGVCAAGLVVRLRVDGEPVPLAATVDLSAYRIVQEALTNALKHAGSGTQVGVCLRFTTHMLEVEVTDDGRGAATASDGGGHGLRGIAERVGLLGGELAAGPADSGGFLVRARLPLDVAA
jgi:signal transduction histidine kinase